MARLFDDANSQDLTRTDTAGFTGLPVTMACWFMSDDIAAAQALMGLYNTGSTSGLYALFAQGNVAGDPVRAWHIQDNGTSSFAATTTGYSANTWHHACAIFASTASRTAYIDGGSSATETTSRSAPTPDIFRIASRKHSGAADAFVSGRIAEAAVWFAALTADEVAELAKGVSPKRIRPESLVAYWDIVGKNSPEIDQVGGYDLTLSASAPTAADHPRIFMPRRRQILVPSAAGGGIVDHHLLLMGAGT